MEIKTAYEELANAIILQAVKDIRRENAYARSAKVFLKSAWFKELSKTDGKLILRKLEKEKINKRKMEKEAVCNG